LPTLRGRLRPLGRLILLYRLCSLDRLHRRLRWHGLSLLPTRWRRAALRRLSTKDTANSAADTADRLTEPSDRLTEPLADTADRLTEPLPQSLAKTTDCLPQSLAKTANCLAKAVC
jgi:hypothetical protein